MNKTENRWMCHLSALSPCKFILWEFWVAAFSLAKGIASFALPYIAKPSNLFEPAIYVPVTEAPSQPGWDKKDEPFLQ